MRRPSLVLYGAFGSVLLGLSACSSSSAPDDGEPNGDVPPSVASHDFSWGTFALADSVQQRIESGQPLRIVVSVQGTGVPVFGAQQRTGMESACEDNETGLTVECRLAGPATTNAAQQLSELETLQSSSQVDCLVLQTPDDTFTSIVNRYVDGGIPVFTENTDLPDSNRFAFYALDEAAAAESNGQITASIVSADGLNIDEVAMGSGAPTAAWAQQRLTGFTTGYTGEVPEAAFANQPDDALPTGQNFTTQEVIDSVGPYLAAHPDVNLFFHTDQGVEGVGDVIKSQGLTGQVFTSGYNVSGPILDMIDTGEILLTIDQGFDNQAAAGVQGCLDYLSDGTVPSDPIQFLEPIVVTKDGIDGTMNVTEAKARLEAAS